MGTRLSLLPLALFAHDSHVSIPTDVRACRPAHLPAGALPFLATPEPASPRPWVLASMISLMRPEPTLFLAANFTLYHVPHLRLSSLKERSLELMNTSFHSSLLSTEYCSTKPAGGVGSSGQSREGQGRRGPALTPSEVVGMGKCK